MKTFLKIIGAVCMILLWPSVIAVQMMAVIDDSESILLTIGAAFTMCCGAALQVAMVGYIVMKLVGLL